MNRIVQKLRETEDWFYRIVEAAKDAIIMVDNEGRIFYWNSAAGEIFGYHSREAAGEELTMIIPERYHGHYRKGFNAFKQNGRGPTIGNTFETEAIRKDGTEFPIELSVSAIEIENKWHAVGIARDITDRRRAQEALGHVSEKYRIMLDKQKHAVMLVDVETNLLLEVNAAAVVLYGYSREELLKMRVSDLTESSGRFHFYTNELVDGLDDETYVFFHRTRDGTVFPVEISACMFKWRSRETLCITVRKITEKYWNRTKPRTKLT